MLEQAIITIDLLKKNMETLNFIYDIVRIVDPIDKEARLLSDKATGGRDLHCYNLWNHNKVCNNCISIRAYQQRTALFKLEYVKEKIYMVMAVPVKDHNRVVILELIKDVTESLIINDPKNIESDEVIKLLNKVNQSQIRDGLTGLYNRRFINERLPGDMINGFADLKRVSIIIADIDHFKAVNDNYGHVAGDFVLKEFSKLLLSSVDEKDGWIARYGGEEFLISLKDAGRQRAQKVAEKLRTAVENSVLEHEGREIKITCSFGVSTLYSKKNVTVEDWINSADENLYRAKSQGRNKVISGYI